ncbi:hypothetical protein ACFR97_17450 [Haloplanus litoreus]|uniref:Uncharacterized protein n=1 Tax=Haloplanus litoreus TaxID=767515 RepID=A0ABD5ZX55_9EURY
MEDDDGNFLVDPEPKDTLDVPTRNIDQTRQDVTAELSTEGAEPLSA